MGCVCGKPNIVEDVRQTLRGRQLSRESNKGLSNSDVPPRVISSKRDENFPVKEWLLDGGDNRVRFTDKKFTGLNQVGGDYVERLLDGGAIVAPDYPAIASIPKATEGEQVAAGWPSWLAAVAGEAISGWVPRRANTFERLDKIGQGTYSNVYKARDLTHMKVVALKRVRFDNMDPESVKFMAREILVLRRLDHPNVIALEGLVTSRTSCSLYLVFEYMEHDLMGLASLPGVKFSEPQIKCYMQQLLSGLDHCHSRGVLHRDIKGSNLLVDNHGILKIADFGLASFFDPHQRVPMTSCVVTLWYRPPELLLGAAHYGASVDLWSTGCILGEIYAGKPIMPGRTEVEQLHKIFKLCGSPSEDYWRKSKLPHSTVFKPLQPYKQRLAETFKDFPPLAVWLMETLLSVDPENRGTAASALKSEYFTTIPLACDPSSLPKYPPSKEIDTKLRHEDAKRKEVTGGRGQRDDQETGAATQPRAVPAQNTNAEAVKSLQTRQSNSGSKSRSEKFARYQEDGATGFPIGPQRQTRAAKEADKDLADQNPRRAPNSGPLVSGSGWKKAGKKYDDIVFPSSRANLSTLSGLVASRALLSEECPDKLFPSQLESENQLGMSSVQYEVSGPMRKNDRIFVGVGSQRLEKTRASVKEAVLNGHGSKGNKMHYSGPLLRPSDTNMDQVLKEHERRIQEAGRRARLEKARLAKGQDSDMQIPATNQIYVSSRGAG
ncbi:probable serine/threonine-protein kinase At1g54610 [Rhododendron vialii]|uniref:probable serine/threonine-protein kinase At1g54610 n=1 Tax=Rhododendron vialii TaxID=182163 RepID=UPI00265F7729|nr:probable serine/threonine-protein kinase At1g54610 [Rhododendron vialii]XP_058218613.1 probable serine/threonine-protein kinase At1g54610 [Rhododendron vialii]